MPPLAPMITATPGPIIAGWQAGLDGADRGSSGDVGGAARGHAEPASSDRYIAAHALSQDVARHHQYHETYAGKARE